MENDLVGNWMIYQQNFSNKCFFVVKKNIKQNNCVVKFYQLKVLQNRSE